MFQPVIDVGGVAGPVPAKAYSQADVTITSMLGRRARRPGGERGGQLKPHRRAVLPGSETEPAKPFAEPAGADPAADSTVQRGPCPLRSGRPGSCRATVSGVRDRRRPVHPADIGRATWDQRCTFTASCGQGGACGRRRRVSPRRQRAPRSRPLVPIIERGGVEGRRGATDAGRTSR